MAAKGGEVLHPLTMLFLTSPTTNKIATVQIEKVSAFLAISYRQNRF
jgi:hypothetical protein